MSILNGVRSAIGGYWSGFTGGGYDAIETKSKRKPASPKLVSGDAELLPEQRRHLVGVSRDITRNFAIARWLVNKHLDYVSTFSFQPETGNEALDEKLKTLMADWSLAENCDIAGRHGFRRIIRMAEARRTIDGDIGILKLASGQLQAIEGDRIRTPTGTLSDEWIPGQYFWGVLTDAAGKAQKYSVCKRIGWQGAFEFERLVSANDLFLFGYFDRFDQTRGISPLASAINSFRDVYEGIDYALAKMKISQLFGLTIYSENPDGTELAGGPEDGDKYEVDLGGGPFKLELDPNDRAEILESNTPSNEMQAFSQLVIGIALKSLDLPYSFYQENYSNYSGSRQALLMYEQSAAVKREDVRELLNNLTRWRILLWWLDGEFPGVDFNDIRWGWIPAGLPWIDPENETNAELAQINGGLDNPEDICRRHGKDFRVNIDKTRRCREYAASQGVPLLWVGTGATEPAPPPPPLTGDQSA